MFEIALKILVCLIIVAILGFFIGYFVGRNRCNGKTNKKKKIGKMDKPIPLAVARNNTKDNLSKIKGIGIQIERSLNKIGVYHYDQIASWNKQNIAWVDHNISFPGRVERDQWIEQAALLAKGEETYFSKRVDAGDVKSSHKS